MLTASNLLAFNDDDNNNDEDTGVDNQYAQSSKGLDVVKETDAVGNISVSSCDDLQTTIVDTINAEVLPAAAVTSTITEIESSSSGDALKDNTESFVEKTIKDTEVLNTTTTTTTTTTSTSMDKHSPLLSSSNLYVRSNTAPQKCIRLCTESDDERKDKEEEEKEDDQDDDGVDANSDEICNLGLDHIVKEPRDHEYIDKMNNEIIDDVQDPDSEETDKTWTSMLVEREEEVRNLKYKPLKGEAEFLEMYPLETDFEFILEYTRRTNKLLSNNYDLAISVARKITRRKDLNSIELEYMKSVRYNITENQCAFNDLRDGYVLNNIGNLQYYKDVPNTFLKKRKIENFDKNTIECNLLENVFCDNSVMVITGSVTGLQESSSKDNVVWFNGYTKKYTAVNSEYERYKDKSSENFFVQDVITHVQRNFRKDNGLIVTTPNDATSIKADSNFIRIYRSAKLNKALLGLCTNVKYVKNKETNSLSDFTVFRYNCEIIECEQVITLESFLCFLLQYRDFKRRFDVYEGEWMFILYIYWNLCAQDLKKYKESESRSEEKAILGYLMYEIYKSVMRQVNSNEKTFKLYVICNAIRKLKLIDRKIVPIAFLEYIKHYFSLFTVNIKKNLQKIWNDVFQRLGVHHPNCLHTFTYVMKRRKRMLLYALQCVYNTPIEEVREKDVDLSKYILPWLYVGEFDYMSVLDNQKIQVPDQLTSRFYKMTGEHISRVQINFLFTNIFEDESQISSRLQYEMETFYQFFIECLVEYVYNIDLIDCVNLHNTHEFFQSKMKPVRNLFGHINCVTNIGVTYTMNRLVCKSFQKSIYNMSSNNSFLSLRFSKKFIEMFFTLINECLSYACYPIIVLYDNKSMDSFSLNTLLCECLDKFRDKVVENCGIATMRQEWYVASMSNLDINYSPEVLDAFKDPDRLWRFVNALSVTDYDDELFPNSKRARIDNGESDDDVGSENHEFRCEKLNDRIQKVLPYIDNNFNVSIRKSVTNDPSSENIYRIEENNVNHYKCTEGYESDSSCDSYDSLFSGDYDEDGDVEKKTDDETDNEEESKQKRYDQIFKLKSKQREQKLYLESLVNDGNDVCKKIQNPLEQDFDSMKYVEDYDSDDDDDDDDVSGDDNNNKDDDNEIMMEKKRIKTIDPENNNNDCGNDSSSCNDSINDGSSSDSSSSSRSSNSGSSSSSESENSDDDNDNGKNSSRNNIILRESSSIVSVSPSKLISIVPQKHISNGKYTLQCVDKHPKSVGKQIPKSICKQKPKSIGKQFSKNIGNQIPGSIEKKKNKHMSKIDGKYVSQKLKTDKQLPIIKNIQIKSSTNKSKGKQIREEVDVVSEKTKRQYKPRASNGVAKKLSSRRKVFTYDPNKIYETKLTKIDYKCPPIDHTKTAILPYIKEHMDHLLPMYDVGMLTEKNSPYFNTCSHPESLKPYLLPLDYFKKYDECVENAEPRPNYWIYYDNPPNDGNKKNECKRLFGINSVFGIKNGRSAKKCVLCPFNTTTSFNMVITPSRVVGACLYCVHFINLHIIHNRMSYKKIKKILMIRLTCRFKTPLFFDNKFNYIKKMPVRNHIKEVHLRTYNKRHPSYNKNLALTESEILERLAIAEANGYESG